MSFSRLFFIARNEIKTTEQWLKDNEHCEKSMTNKDKIPKRGKQLTNKKTDKIREYVTDLIDW